MFTRTTRVPGQPRGQRGWRSQQTTAERVCLLTRVKWEGGAGQGQPGAGDSEAVCGLRAPLSLAAWAVGTGRLTRVSVSRAPGAPTGGVASVLQRGLSPEAVTTFNSSGGNLRGGLEDAPPGPARGQDTGGERHCALRRGPDLGTGGQRKGEIQPTLLLGHSPRRNQHLIFLTDTETRIQ